MNEQSLSNRMKSYEDDTTLKNDAWIIIRVDGKNFHNWTQKMGATTPFDSALMNAMDYATRLTAKQMQGFRLAYTQSDEATFALQVSEPSEPWFGNKPQKLISVTASMFTYYFNSQIKRQEAWDNFFPAFFDARVYIVPEFDVPNVFVWRQQDWYRNSTMMIAREFYSHNDLQGKNLESQMRMIQDAGGFDSSARHDCGTIITQDGAFLHCDQNYNEFADLLKINY